MKGSYHTVWARKARGSWLLRGPAIHPSSLTSQPGDTRSFASPDFDHETGYEVQSPPLHLALPVAAARTKHRCRATCEAHDLSAVERGSERETTGYEPSVRERQQVTSTSTRERAPLSSEKGTTSMVSNTFVLKMNTFVLKTHAKARNWP